MNLLTCSKFRAPKNQGFTMMEMILVIIILGIMSVGISGFISLSTQTYVNASARDELIGNARFVIERLNRELRNAAPNSIRTRTFNGGLLQCIQFTPIAASTVYTDIPVLPEPASLALSVIPFNDTEGNPYQCDRAAGCTDLVTIYPLNTNDIYADLTSATGKIFRIDDVDTTESPWKLNILNAQNVTFTEDSPTSRLYVINEQVSYCNSITPTPILFRASGAVSDGVQSYPGASEKRVPMAGYFTSDIRSNPPFNYQPATLQRNAVVQIHLEFMNNDERYAFDHEVHIKNVP